MRAQRWQVRAITEVGPAFDRAYAFLHSEFGPRGELERRAIIEGWLARGPWTDGDGLTQRYAMFEAVDDRGELAGVRDCHVVLDETGTLAVVYLAHVVVAAAHRRTGLGEILREAPIAIAREGEGVAREILLCAEMEPVQLADPDSLGRLIAYGRAGFGVIDPSAFPYSQPDFRDPALIGDAPRPLPLLAVVRRLGHEGALTLPARLAAAYQRHLDAVFSTHCLPAHLAPRRDHALASLARAGGEVALLSLPRAADDRAAIAPLLREAVLRHHVEEDADGPLGPGRS